MINNKDMIGIKLVELPSVGSLLDPDTGVIYPQFSETDLPDLSLEISLAEGEVSSDWWESLSKEDFEKCKVWY